MTGNNRFAILSEAVSLGMQAMVGGLDPLDVDALVTRTQQLLDPDDAVARAVTTFATQHEVCRHDPVELARIGAQLRDQMIRIMRPEPPDLHRRDIHG